MELGVGLFISFMLLYMFIKAINQGQFDDTKKQMNGLLFDSTEDLQDAINKDNKIKKLKENMVKKS
jgi:cbb3-type cytochrome oxidase maturation protein